MPAGRPRKQIEVSENELPEQPYFTVNEVAEITGCHIHTIQARLRDGTLRGKKLGGTWRVYRDSIVTETA